MADMEQIQALLRRIQLFLEDAQWSKAEEYSEKVLDIDPENADAYLYKLMVEQRAKNREALAEGKPFAHSSHYQKVMRFGDAQLRAALTELNSRCVQKETAEKKDKLYAEAVAQMKKASVDGYRCAIKNFEAIPGWKDADAQAALCREKLQQLQEKNAAKAATRKKLLKRSVIAGIAACVLCVGAVVGVKHYNKKQAEAIDLFNGGAVFVEIDGKWGCVNKQGKFTIKPRFDDVYLCEEDGLAMVRVDGKYGYVSNKGKIAIEPQYDGAASFSTKIPGVAVVRQGYKQFYIDKNGKKLLNIHDDWGIDITDIPLIGDWIKNEYYYIKIGRLLLLPPLSGDLVSVQADGFAIVDVDGKYGYINEKGKIVIEPQFDNALEFSQNGLGIVKIDGKWGYINKKGKIVIKPQFGGADTFAENGLALVYIDSKYGYINKKGKMVIEPQFERAESFAENGLASVRVDGKWGYINKKGEMVIEPQFDSAGSFAENGLALVYVADKWGYINKKGKTVIEPQFDSAESFAENGLAMVKIDGKWGYINKKGKMVVQPQFDSAESFWDDGYARVTVDGKCGIIDSKGKYLYEPQFDSITPFSHSWWSGRF